MIGSISIRARCIRNGRLHGNTFTLIKTEQELRVLTAWGSVVRGNKLRVQENCVSKRGFSENVTKKFNYFEKRPEIAEKKREGE